MKGKILDKITKLVFRSTLMTAGSLLASGFGSLICRPFNPKSALFFADISLIILMVLTILSVISLALAIIEVEKKDLGTK